MNIKRFKAFEAIISEENFSEMVVELRNAILLSNEDMELPPPPPPPPGMRMGGRQGMPPPGMRMGPGRMPEGMIPPNRMGGIPRIKGISLSIANEISNKYNVYFKNYNQFYNDLPDRVKHTAPERNGMPMFGHISEDSKIVIVVTTSPLLTIAELPFLEHMCEHESIHIKQKSKRNGKVEWTLPDPKDKESYFSTKDEIMAFSQSIVNLTFSMNQIVSKAQFKYVLSDNPLWKEIKRHVGQDIQNRYMKYIYQYMEAKI